MVTITALAVISFPQDKATSRLSLERRNPVHLRRKIEDTEGEIWGLRDLADVYGRRGARPNIYRKDRAETRDRKSRAGREKLDSLLPVGAGGGEFTEEDMKTAFAREEKVGKQMPNVCWIRSYYSVEGGKLYCEYEALSLEMVLEFNRRMGIPVDRATMVENLAPSMFR